LGYIIYYILLHILYNCKSEWVPTDDYYKKKNFVIQHYNIDV